MQVNIPPTGYVCFFLIVLLCIMKKIFIVLVLSCGFLKSHAQSLSKEDAQIVKDIQTTIVTMKDKVNKGFDDYVVGDEMARNTEIIQYQSIGIKTMHAKESLVLKNVDKSGDLLAFEYDDKKNISLAYKAILDIPAYGSSKWTFKAKLDVSDTVVAKYLFYNDSPIGYFMKSKKNEFLYFYFLYLPPNNVETNKKDNRDTTNIELDLIKVVDLQIAFEKLIVKGQTGFTDLIFKPSTKDTDFMYFDAAEEKNMLASDYRGIKLLPNGGKYYLCSYTNTTNVAIALRAIETLDTSKNGLWEVDSLDMNDKNLIGKKIYYNSNYVAYTTYIKDANQFFIAVKDQLYKEEAVVPKKKVVGKKKK